MKLPSLLLWTVPCCSPNRTATGLLKKIMLIILEMACDVQIIKILTETGLYLQNISYFLVKFIYVETGETNIKMAMWGIPFIT